MFYLDLSEYDGPESEKQLQENCSLMIKYGDNQGISNINGVHSRRPPPSLIVSRRVRDV